MKRFLDEVRTVLYEIWPLALLFSGFILLMFIFERGYFSAMLLPGDPAMREWSVAGQIAFATVPALLAFAYVLLVGYINNDAKRRGMRHIVWTRLAIFIPYGLGGVLYFILRYPLQIPCPKCRVRARTNYAFCPHCGTDLRPQKQRNLGTCP